MKYVTAHDLAWYWFCDRQAILRAREREPLYEATARRHLGWMSVSLDKAIPKEGVFPISYLPETGKGVEWAFYVEPYIVLAKVTKLGSDSIHVGIGQCSNVVKRLYVMQAHICGWLYNRPKAVVEIGSELIVEDVNVDKVKRTFTCFRQLDLGESKPFLTTMKWKCDSCKFHSECIL